MTLPDSTPPALPSSSLDRFLAGDLEGDALRRGRLIVGFAVLSFCGYILALLPLGWLGWAASFAGVGAGAVITLAALGAMRNQKLAPSAAAWVVFPTAIFVLVGLAAADMGLSAPELVWLAVLPFTAALAGGKRLATVTSLLISLGVVGLAVRGALVPFPKTAPAPLVSMVAMLSLAGVAVTGAILGQVYNRSVAVTLEEQRRSLGRLADALRQSEARYRSALENVPVGVVQTTVEGRFLLANRAMAHLLGYDSADEMAADGRLAVDFYANDGAREAFVQALHTSGSVHRYETVWQDRRGRPLHVRIDAHARRGAGGSLIGIEGIVEDVTAEVEARQRLLQSEARFRALVQRSSDVVAVVDRGGMLTYASPSIETLTGYAPAQLVGQPASAFLHPDDAEPGRSIFDAVHGSDASVPATEFRIRHREGHFLFAEGVGTPLFNDPSVQGLVINFRDVTERKRAEAVLVHAKEQAEEVAQLKSTFLANMSHEIRTPLTGILGFASILADEVTDPQQKEFVDLIEQSGRRLMETLNSVLDLAKLDAGRMDLAAEPVPLAEAARESVRLLAPLASEKRLALVAQVEDEGASADLDRGALDRVLTNLVGNAIKFTESGEVRIVVRGNDAQVALDVVDTGVGIEEAFLPRLFEEFHQESAGAERTHEGSGLGLAITRQLVERMDGHISVESEKGVGTTFTIVFPRSLERASGEEAATPEAAAAPEGPRTPRVLVVDDNAQTLRMAERMIESVYRVVTAGSASGAEEAALQAAREGDPFDVLLLDINLGSMDTGEDVMRRLRLQPPYGTRGIVAFTAYALPGDRERFLASGFDGYLSKPFTRETLLGAVADAIGEAAPAAPAPKAARFIIRNRRGEAAPEQPAPKQKAKLPVPTSIADQLLQAEASGSGR